MQARGFLNYRLKYCWPKVINCSLCVNQTNFKWEIKKKTVGTSREPSKNLGGGMTHPGPPLNCHWRLHIIGHINVGPTVSCSYSSLYAMVAFKSVKNRLFC